MSSTYSMYFTTLYLFQGSAQATSENDLFESSMDYLDNDCLWGSFKQNIARKKNKGGKVKKDRIREVFLSVYSYREVSSSEMVDTKSYSHVIQVS